MRFLKFYKCTEDIQTFMIYCCQYFDENNDSKYHEIIIEIFLYTYRFRKARPI